MSAHKIAFPRGQGSTWSQSNLGSSSVDAAGSRMLVGGHCLFVWYIYIDLCCAAQVELLERGDSLHLKERATSAQRAGLGDVSLCLTLNHPTD